MRLKPKKLLIIGTVLVILLFTMYHVHEIQKENVQVTADTPELGVIIDDYNINQSDHSKDKLANVDLDNVDLDNVDLDNVDSDNVDFNNLDVDKVDVDVENGLIQLRSAEKSSSFAEQCSNVKPIEHNGADIQVSALVEELDFHLDHGGKDMSSFPNLKPLPTSEPLKVFLVPHSHCDPGWLETYTEYYQKTVRNILTNMYKFAMGHEDFKYIFAEVSFFKLWWDEQGETAKRDMRLLASQGRFEFVQGGWVQADESSTHYFALINQMLDGHDWLIANFPEAIPKSGWAIDPFGLSPMMGYVNKLFGLDAMHIQRVHYSVKNHLAESRNLDFRWRQAWDDSGSTDILTHLAPFFGYNSKYTCGPDPDVCDQYNFRMLVNPRWLRPHRYLQRTTSSNVKERSVKILDQWRKKAALHSTNAVLIEVGDDFTYHQADVLPEVYDNYKAIIDYINSDSVLNTKVAWGTLSEYFDEVRKHGPAKLPTLSGDFFTYADRQEDYWSGYYTSRPFYKNLDRVLESALRRTEILFSFQRSSVAVSQLVAARNALSLFQHHDGITGTSKPKVVNDYGARLYNAYKACNDITISVMKYLLKEDSKVTPVSGRSTFNALEKYNLISVQSDLLFANTLPRSAQTVQIVAVQNSFQVVDENGISVLQQVEPRIEFGEIHIDSKYLVFASVVPSVSIQRRKLVTSANEHKASVEIYNSRADSTIVSMFHAIAVSERDCQDIVIGSQNLSLKLDCRTGRVVSIAKSDTTVNIEQEVLLYKGNSGVYIFLPSGAPNQLLTSSSRPKIIVLKGKLRHKAVVYLRNLSTTLVLTYTISLLEGEAGEYIDLEILSDLKDTGDLAIKFKTDLKSGDSIFTDLNGHTIQQHKFKEKLKTQGNFFPMPSTAFIQDSTTRFTLLSSEPHAAASLSQGSLAIVLDRRTTINDDRGLGEGITDNLPTPSRLRILVEKRSGAPVWGAAGGYVVEYPSLRSYQAQQTLLNPIFMGFKSGIETLDTTVQLMKSMPCGEELVNLRQVSADTCLLIRRKLGFTCQVDCQHCDHDPEVPLKDWFNAEVAVQEHPMSPFHQHSGERNLKSKAMEFTSHYVTFI